MPIYISQTYEIVTPESAERILSGGIGMRIVWNGIDGYIETENAIAFGYRFDGEKLYHGSESFQAFDVVEIMPQDLPKDEDGEPDFNGVFGCPISGRFYR